MKEETLYHRVINSRYADFALTEGDFMSPMNEKGKDKVQFESWIMRHAFKVNNLYSPLGGATLSEFSSELSGLKRPHEGLVLDVLDGNIYNYQHEGYASGRFELVKIAKAEILQLNPGVVGYFYMPPNYSEIKKPQEELIKELLESYSAYLEIKRGTHEYISITTQLNIVGMSWYNCEYDDIESDLRAHVVFKVACPFTEEEMEEQLQKNLLLTKMMCIEQANDTLKSISQLICNLSFKLGQDSIK